MIEFLDPDKIIDQIPLRENEIVADFGCGAGGFTIPIAKRLRKGFVYAIDIQEEPLSALKGNAKLAGVSNIKTIQGDLEEPKGSGLPDHLVDFVTIVNLFFQVENKLGVLKEAKRVLKRDGRILIIDWRKDSPFGPDEGRVEQGEIEKLGLMIELSKEREIDAGSYHWGIILKPKKNEID